MTMKKKIPAPLSIEQLKAKVKEIPAVIPKHATMPSTSSRVNSKDIATGKAKFSHTDISAIGYSEEVVGVDTDGKEHKFGGGVWINLNWSVPGFGFGEIELRKTPGGKIQIQTERLGKEFAKAMFCDLIDRAEEKE
jgi:hypothetical protein